MEETFNFNNEKTKQITFEQLNESVKLLDSTGSLPRSKPIEHCDLFAEVMERLDKHGYVYEPPVIHVSSKPGSNLITRKDSVLDPYHISNWLFKKLVGVINIVPLSDEQSNTAIAIGYNDMGLQITWGTNVKICRNMSIFGQWYMSTYGARKMPDMNKFWTVFNEWIQRAELKREFDTTIFKAMLDTQITRNDFPDIFGILLQEAVQSTYIDKREAPLSINQTSAFTREILATYAGKETINAFNLYNAGTRILSPDAGNDLATLWERNVIFGLFCIDYFHLRSCVADQKFNELVIDI